MTADTPQIPEEENEEQMQQWGEEMDLDLQEKVAKAILKAEEDGNLAGTETPAFRCHMFLPTKAGHTYASILTRQLNHLAESLGVLGFQVLYHEDPVERSGYFITRAFAISPDTTTE